MTLRVLAAGAALSLLAGPAWADCAAEIEALDESIVAAETGAAPQDSALPATQHQAEVLSPDAAGAGAGAGAGAEPGDEQAAEAADGAGMPATEHQQQVLSGEQAPTEEAPVETGAGTATGSGSGDVEAASPHQREVVRELDDDTKTQASALTDEARELAAAGDEAGCLAKVGEAKALLGTQ
jgi:hypothetical protein